MITIKYRTGQELCLRSEDGRLVITDGSGEYFSDPLELDMDGSHTQDVFKIDVRDAAGKLMMSLCHWHNDPNQAKEL